MWTPQNRKRYDRSRLRYPSDLTDEEWAHVAPLIPGCDERGHVRLEHGLSVARPAQGPSAEEHGT
jgi:hypothetical protein